jgi:hypothetical protein
MPGFPRADLRDVGGSALAKFGQGVKRVHRKNGGACMDCRFVQMCEPDSPILFDESLLIKANLLKSRDAKFPI